MPVFRSHHRCVRRRPLTIPGSQQQGPEAMSGTGATLFTDSSVRVRRYSVIVGKVSVDANVAENDGSPVFIGDSSLGSAPGALILFRRPRRDGQDGTMGNGHKARRDWWALSSFFCEKGGGALSPIAQTGRCCVWLWWAGVVVSCCVVVGMCEEPIPVWDVASIANLGLVWGSPSHPDHQMACALRSLRPMPGRITAQCPQWTWLALADACSVQRHLLPFPQCSPRFLPTTVAVGWCVDTGGQARWLQHIARLARDLDPWCFPARPVCLFSLTSNTSIGS